MKYLFLLLLAGCASLPNASVCANDAPKHAHCAFMVSGNDFEVDNSGTHQYTQDGRNWNYDQLIQNSLIMPVDSYGKIKKWFLNYCHRNPSQCKYTPSKLESVEASLNLIIE